MNGFWFWVLMALIFCAAATWPTWPFTRDRWLYRRGGAWRYVPTGVIIAVIAMLLLLVWLGVIRLTWPWAVAPVAIE